MATREGNNIGRPPLLESHNYGIWKSKMRAFIMSIDELAWLAIEEGWKAPIVKDAHGNDQLKSPLKWNVAEKKAAINNSRVMNTLFAAVDEENFRLISDCSTAKSAWDTLQIAFEGTTKVKINRLQMVSTKFEALKMQDDETISEYFKKLKDLSSESASLGEPMSQEKMVRKMLRSLSSRFDTKIYAIEEAHDITTMPLEELIGILKTHEMNLNEKAGVGKKSWDVALKSEGSTEHDTKEDLAEQVTALIKSFDRIMEKLDKRSLDQRSTKDSVFSVQCKECQGHGQNQLENNIIAYATQLDKTPIVIPTEVPTEASTEVTKEADSDSESDSELDEAELIVKFTELHEKWKSVVEVNSKLNDERSMLISKVETLETMLAEEKEKHAVTKGELSRQKKYMHMMNQGSKNLSEILAAQRLQKGHSGLGYENQQCSEKTKFVPAKTVTTETSTEAVKETPKQKKENPIRLCYYCNKPGHIQIRCPEFRRSYRKKKLKLEPTGRYNVSPKVPKEEPKQEKLSDPNEVPKHEKLKPKDTRTCYYCNKQGHIQKNCGKFLKSNKRKSSEAHPKQEMRKSARRQPSGPIYRNYAPQTEMVWRVKEKKNECRTMEPATEVVVENISAPAKDVVTDIAATTDRGCHNLQTSKKNTNTSAGGAKTDVKTKEIANQIIKDTYLEAPNHVVDEFIELWCSWLHQN